LGNIQNGRKKMRIRDLTFPSDEDQYETDEFLHVQRLLEDLNDSIVDGDFEEFASTLEVLNDEFDLSTPKSLQKFFKELQ
jgi:hypothetical protein